MRVYEVATGVYAAKSYIEIHRIPKPVEESIMAGMGVCCSSVPAGVHWLVRITALVIDVDDNHTFHSCIVTCAVVLQNGSVHYITVPGWSAEDATYVEADYYDCVAQSVIYL